jgi:hypothetical protein
MWLFVFYATGLTIIISFSCFWYRLARVFVFSKLQPAMAFDIKCKSLILDLPTILELGY